MRGTYVHTASLRMENDGDTAAPGAAITMALCGHWEHPPPCPLAAHHTAVQRDGGTLGLRTIFAADPEQEGEVRRRITAALARGSQAGPGGRVSRWIFIEAAAGELTPAELVHAERLANT